MAKMNIFSDDSFKASSLTASINQLPTVPSVLADEGIFAVKAINTTVAQVEIKAGKLELVPSAVRGAGGKNKATAKRKMVPINLVHLPQNDAVLADSVQGIRAMGKTSELEQVQVVVANKLLEMKADNDATVEFQRACSLKGKVVDADGSIIIDTHALLGHTPTTSSLALGVATTKVKNKILAVKRAISKKLGGRMITQWHGKCSPTFFDMLTSHTKVEKAFERYENGAALREDMSDSFVFGGVKWSVYDITVDGTNFIDDGSAYLYPAGVPGMFITAIGPADYLHTVNTLGQPYYASLEVMKHNKGVEIEVQSNTVSFCAIPDGIATLTA